ncbi:MAG: pilus assembly protein TadG-related protein [Terracidiphilus sp.]
MNQLRNLLLPRLIKDESGQVLPWMALLMVLFLGMAGLTIDLGRAYVCYRELQASSDAAALAGAQAMTPSAATVASVTSAACTFSSNTTAGTNCPVGLNTTPNMGTVTTTPTLHCVSTGSIVSVACANVPVGNNVIQVAQTATIKTYFIQALAAFGVKSATSLTLNATSTAGVTGTSPPINMAIVIDTTASMNDTDGDKYCGHTELYCALQGVQSLLTALTPCTAGSSAKAGCLGAYDSVSLFTFPNIEADTASDDTTCNTPNPTIGSYSYVPIPSTTNTSYTAPSSTSKTLTYQVTTYEDDYSATDGANGGLATSSPLAIAAGANTTKNCGGLQAPGGVETYIAGAMYQAMTSLQAQAAANPNSVNALVLLTDGGANSGSFGSGFSKTSGTYPSTIDQCQQTVAAGQYATKLGIKVYTVAYGATTSTSGCTTDTGKNAISPCTELEETASSPEDFFSDATATESKGQCVSADNSGLAGLPAIFQKITLDFLKSRLVPNTVVITGG